MSIMRNGRRAAKSAKAYVLPPEQLEKREKAFAVYRDMGHARSLVALERELKRNHPAIGVSRPTLEKWSKQHQWQERIRVHDAAAPSQVNVSTQAFSPEFDQVNAL